MAFRPRHSWVAARLSAAFNLEEDEAQRFVEENIDHFNGIFNVTGPQKLFVCYDSSEGPASEFNPTHLYISYSGNEKAVGGKTVYFLRNTDTDKAIDLDKFGDDRIICGEVSPKLLEELKVQIQQLYSPNLHARSNWGKAPEYQKQELLEDVDHFVTSMGDLLESVESGVGLMRPEPQYLAERAPTDRNMVQHFESVLESWCRTIESLLSKETEVFVTDDQIGPRELLDWWRKRMLRLTSVTEQLKSSDCTKVIAVLSQTLKSQMTSTSSPGFQRSSVYSSMQTWRHVNSALTEAANEAKDNVKYLFTLEKFINPLYSGTPKEIQEALPALMNSVKMIYTIARHFNTPERMTDLMLRITNQMIIACKSYILAAAAANEEAMESNDMWKKDVNDLLPRLNACLQLRDAYHEIYTITKENMHVPGQSAIGVKPLDLDERKIFGRLDLFARRIIKLIDLFSTIQQFERLLTAKIEGMDKLLQTFFSIVKAFKAKRHNLLRYQDNQFDRDYVEFNAKISELEEELQSFINSSFERITSIEKSLEVIDKFRSLLHRESLRSDLENKYDIIFKTYGRELQLVQNLYERYKHAPPKVRNLPPVAANITWSRHLLKRIEDPMRSFSQNEKVLSGREARAIVKTYNKIAKTLVAFEYLWYQAWFQSIEAAKAGLQATLIIRHPDDGKLYVNFDGEIVQLIRETKCLARMGIQIPDSAKIVLLQEQKLKTYYDELSYALGMYERIRGMIISVTAELLRPHLQDMELKLRPGMISLTWTSMNIDAYKHQVMSGLKRLEELVMTVNDIIENRIEKNLRIISKSLLVDLPADATVSLEEFVDKQEQHVADMSTLLQQKNIEVESAVMDLVDVVTSTTVSESVEPVAQHSIDRFIKHYNYFMYQSLLTCSKNSLNAVKKRVSSRAGGTSFLFVQRPFFEVDVQLRIPLIVASPNLDQIQHSINRCATTVLSCSKQVYDWGQAGVAQKERATFYERITKDMELVRVVLLLTGSIQGTRTSVGEFLSSFRKFEWMWTEDADKQYEEFQASNPQLDDYERQLLRFWRVDQEIDSMEPVQNIGTLTLQTRQIKVQLKQECAAWRERFSSKLHSVARGMMESFHDYIKEANRTISRPITGLESLADVMEGLRKLRFAESTVTAEKINPILDMYAMLERYLPDGHINKEEMDQKSVIRSQWRKLLNKAEEVTEGISHLQVGMKRELLANVKTFVVDTIHFRQDFMENGPMVEGLQPTEAMERLKRYSQEFELRKRKRELYCGGERLFALPVTAYPELDDTEKELGLLDKLYTLYAEVMNRMDEWSTILWVDVVSNMENMTQEIDTLSGKCKKMPKQLREWQAYKDLKKRIEDFQLVLPLLQELSKDSIMPRHWEQVREVTGNDSLDPDDPEFKFEQLLRAGLVDHLEDIEEITDGADKQLGIQLKLEEISEYWRVKVFNWQEWKNRGVQVLAGVTAVVEELEEAQMNVQTMLTMKHVKPFKEEASTLLLQLSNTSETLEQWLKVQLAWGSLESVFLGGDIAKQMPVVAKKFAKIDKDFVKIMEKAHKTGVIVEACADELLQASLPVMYSELEKCQKSLEGYLEQKRNKFPRFYFVSNPVLLQILSQGSDPMAVQAYYEKIFDSIVAVEHDKKDKHTILKMISRLGNAEERIPFTKPVKAAGNIEEWLMVLLNEMKFTMKMLCRESAAEIDVASNDVKALRTFVDNQCPQYALLGIQLLWTADNQLALENCKRSKNAMRDCNAKSLAVLQELSSWCLQDLGTKMNRVKIETLVTIQVHQRDVTQELYTLNKQKKLTSADDFEWLKQARFFWQPDASDPVDEDGTCLISVTDVDFNYQYEYLGTKERLVITPLTDRCYITLAQAVGMYFGGAPAGPAGTGKTETVKDMGRTLGIYVVVTNCSPEMQYTDCAKIFKGLCQGGLWGCFDEFNRIELPVLSVVAQQVLSVTLAKKANQEYFYFPGDPQQVLLDPVCGFFITMNPPVKGYSGRQELPENLKALFRGVAMMVPDREIIIKVKLCSVGYSNFTSLAKKFFICYQLCEEQLSKQRHYDFGLRNILSVLRTAGQTKRDNLDADEAMLLYRTLRDMNLSKFVAQDVPLFTSMLQDVFPSIPPPPKSVHENVERAIRTAVDTQKLVQHDTWINKVIQLYETHLVRHGIMLSGPTGGGKSMIFKTLAKALTEVNDIPYKIVKLNPKSVLVQELYGETDILTDEWTPGVLASVWEKYNNRNNKFITWITCDGPVDTIWIESMNTVLDDNKILTLASGDRIPMTDNVKIMFENEHLNNASPATVSRTGIVYVSDTDLDWAPVIEAWVRTRGEDVQAPLRELIEKHFGTCSEIDPGRVFMFLNRQTEPAMTTSRVGAICAFYNLLTAMLDSAAGKMASPSTPDFTHQLEMLVLYSMAWSVGGVLEPTDRRKFDTFLRENAAESMPKLQTASDTIYEYYVDVDTFQWKLWRPPAWEYPNTEELDFSNLLVPTMDSSRAIFVLDALHRYEQPVLLIGGPGTAKTSTALMYFNTFDADKRLMKRINFSSATTCRMFQDTIEADLEKRGGKNFGPPNNKKMTVFIDDMSMPLINKWGDQPTNEIVRQLMEIRGLYALEKDKRGEMRICEDLQYVGAMNHPGGGRNDIPNRLKRLFFAFNMVLPDIASIDDIYGQMLSGRFADARFSASAKQVVSKLTAATIELWRLVQAKMLPTPAKFHYIFNMRELSRVFQGVLLTPKDTILTGGQQTPTSDQASVLLRLWKHECCRVFQDKLATAGDKEWFAHALDANVASNFGDELAAAAAEEAYLVDFFRDDIYDEDDVFVDYGPKVYEEGGSLQNVRERVEYFMDKNNVDNPSRKLELVLFDDALRHLLRISRIIAMPRGSALLVGVGGSGKQSLTRLAAYIARSVLFQITLTKTYNVASLMEDLKELYKVAGHQRSSVTFLFTDAEIKDEAFLEYINSILMTGEVAGLIPKDEMMSMCADLRPYFVKDRPDQEDTQVNLKQYFIDTVRDNLHVVLCMSPVNPRFPVRARMFPGLISGTTIDWFLPWPREALVAVSKGLLGSFRLEAEDEVQAELVQHMGTVHSMVVDVCGEYYSALRRHVYQTPKSYLSFVQNYMGLYKQKLAEVKEKEERVNLGLEKLVKGAADVEALRVLLDDEKVKLELATKDTNEMLEGLKVSSAEAEREGAKVAEIKASCEAEAERIRGEKEQCESDLAAAKPFLDAANKAIQSIKPKDIQEIKTLGKPPPILKVVLDGVLVLFMEKLDSVAPWQATIAKQDVEFLEPSWGQAMSVMVDASFLKRLQEFQKDLINEETVELMAPYVNFEHFNPDVAKSASSAAKGLCTWVDAMDKYHKASKIVKPKLEALAVAEGQLEAAMKALAEAQARLDAVNAKKAELQAAFETKLAEKKRIEDGAIALQRKMDQASALIQGLAGERERWSNDSKTFADVKRRLIGDCAVACAFTSYCGPFNQQFRNKLIRDYFTADCMARRVPVSPDLNVTDFLVDIGTIGDWNLQGLPTDPLSIQNGILVTRSARYPLLIDPQGQAITWIMNKEQEFLPEKGIPKTTAINHARLKDHLEFCMSEGKALVVVGVEEEIDPMLDPVLEKRVVKKGRNMYINVADTDMELSPDFRLYFITRLPNPHFSPELQAKTTVVDFTVTMKGLEEQLLGRVIGKEQRHLEDMLTQVLEEVNSNTKALLELDALLLERLTSNKGNLLDDETLLSVLSNTKAKAAEVAEKLEAAKHTRAEISEQRETFRPVATRGSVLYFSIVEMSLVNVMYQTSLAQFIELFMLSMDRADKAKLPAKRVTNIIDTMTYMVYRYVNKGLYERHKLLFVLIITLKILVTDGLLDQASVSLFLRGGAALDINTVKKRPVWMTDEAWLNALQLSNDVPFFKALPDNIFRNEASWRVWYESNEPEEMGIPDYELPITDNRETGPWLRLLLLRCLRIDRTLLMTKKFINETEQMGERYIEPVTDTIDMIYDDMTAEVPVIFLLSVGADPTNSIEQLCKRKKQSLAVVSMGQGQEKVAENAMDDAARVGSWVLLQNCELGLPLMDLMEDKLKKMAETVNPEFRLFITALPHPKFPLGLLQLGTKVCMEPPNGLKAGLLRSYNVVVSQDRLERIDSQQWRQMMFGFCFLHSIVQERRKFGALGWCTHYDFNNGDLDACLMFLEKHLYAGPISWPTTQYMVGEVQYGGKITDSMDRRLFMTYAKEWVHPNTFKDGFTYNPDRPINRIPQDFVYRVIDSPEMDPYRQYLSKFPEADSPEVFGLHPNADLTYRVQESNALLSTMGETQPRQTGGGGGKSLEDVVTEKAGELLERIPEDYVEEVFKSKIIREHGGMERPLNIFLFQEIQRLQRVIHKVRSMLIAMRQAIKGEVVMTSELLESMNDIFDAKVPESWMWTPGADEFSWIVPQLGLWAAGLQQRDQQLRSWLDDKQPACFWMTGFFNPQGFLTAMKQTVTRLHKAQNWALDDIVYHSEVTEMERVEQVRAPPKEGVYIHGLYLDGAAWSKREGTLVESEPKKLFAPLPVLYVTAVTSALLKTKREMYGAQGPYECPVYKYAERTDRYYIFTVNLVTKEKKPSHWIFRGAALLCSTHAT